MGLNERNDSNKTYLSIIGGQLARRFEEHQEINGKVVTVEREIKDDDGNLIKTKIERYYESIDGIISSAVVNSEGDFGSRLVLDMVDGGEIFVVQISLESNYGRSFMLKCPNIDYTKPVTIRPYSFEDKDSGKKQAGITVYQAGEWENDKVPSKWTKDEPGDMPPWEFTEIGGKKKWNSDKQTQFLVAEFLLWGNAIIPVEEDALVNEPSAEQIDRPEESAEEIIGGEGIEDEVAVVVPGTHAPNATEEDDLPF